MAEEECGNLANIRYTWPGKNEVVVCIDCAQVAQTIAKALGMHLQVIPVTSKDIEDPLQWPHCTVMRDRSEE